MMNRTFSEWLGHLLLIFNIIGAPLLISLLILYLMGSLNSPTDGTKGRTTPE